MSSLRSQFIKQSCSTWVVFCRICKPKGWNALCCVDSASAISYNCFPQGTSDRSSGVSRENRCACSKEESKCIYENDLPSTLVPLQERFTIQASLWAELTGAGLAPCMDCPACLLASSGWKIDTCLRDRRDMLVLRGTAEFLWLQLVEILPVRVRCCAHLGTCFENANSRTAHW